MWTASPSSGRLHVSPFALRALPRFVAHMGTSDFPWTVEFPSGMPVVPLYPLPWRSPWDLPSSRLCRGDVPRSSTPMGSRGPWPSAPLMWPSVLLTTSAPTINRSSRGSIPSRLRIAAHHLPVYASPWSLPSTTQHAVPGAWPGLPGSGPAPDWQSRALLGALTTDRKVRGQEHGGKAGGREKALKL